MTNDATNSLYCLVQVILAAEELGLKYTPNLVDTSKKEQFEPAFVVSCRCLGISRAACLICPSRGKVHRDGKSVHYAFRVFLKASQVHVLCSSK